MEIATGKDEPSMLIDTNEFHAIREIVGAPVGADAKAVVVAAISMRNELNLLSIRMGRITQDVKRQALGILGVVGLSFDDLHAWQIKQEEKEK